MTRMERVAPDQGRVGSEERDIEQAITALKKGAYLLKYGRRGKPKFCPFRLANDETVLIWYSGKEEKRLKLNHVSRIMPGQRTAIFQRYPRPEKECQSFSLIYNERSLDLICKDKDEAEVWFAGLRALISRFHNRKWKTDTRSDGLSSGTTSPRTYTRKSSPLGSPFGSVESLQKDASDAFRFRSPHGSPPKNAFDRAFSDAMTYSISPKGFFNSESTATSFQSLSSVGSDGVNGHMRGLTVDTYRVSLSSAVSSSSQGSGQDDTDAMGDVFIWGEGIGDGFLGGGAQRVSSNSGLKVDSLLPKTLESGVILDVQTVACGERHAVLVTKQGEIYSWGEESGGRLGHGIDTDLSRPKLIDSLGSTNIELVACGECHTCAVTLSGDLYTWGDGTYNLGLLGHGNKISHWIPKRVNGPLEGMHVSYISCGAWHTAAVTSSGQLFTFGDGTFGVLGHGDRTSVSIPREVESLKGFRTIRVACGFWHTAAIVEATANTNSINPSSTKLFTWGDGDKGRLGHGDKEPRLLPTCVSSLSEQSFSRVACGHSLTVALTTSGHVYTMGSPVYGQLGNPQADGKFPVHVDGLLHKNFVEEIACGAYHVAALTSRTEVYTWGKGANGRLGHGDTDDRSSPTLVEALKDKHVRNIVCGTNFTAAICIHKWVSGVDQSICSGCRMPFNFKRKRHNCYNCALVFCHSCSSKKSLKASMAPNPNKPYRVCDSCFHKLKKALENDSLTRTVAYKNGSFPQVTNGMVEEPYKTGDSRSSVQLSRVSSIESLKHLEEKSLKKNKKLDFLTGRVSPVPTGNSQWSSFNISKSLNPVFGTSKKFFSSSVPGSRIVSRATSPVSRRPSPPRSTTPTPTLSGLTTPKLVLDDAKRVNENNLQQEVVQLRVQVENLTRKSRVQEVELERTSKQLREAVAIAEEESAKCKAAKEVIKTLTAQLKDMAERLPVGAAKGNKLAALTFLSANLASPDISSVATDQLSGKVLTHEPEENGSNAVLPNGPSSFGNIMRPGNSVVKNGGKMVDAADPSHDLEWVEQDEPGVYITLTSLPGGQRDLKRVRFSRKRFSEKQAEQWWAENRTRVYEQYNVRMVDRSIIGIPNDRSH